MFPLYDENRPSRRPYVNYMLITVNTVVFFYFFISGWKTLQAAIVNYGTIPIFIISGKRLETLLTGMFIHADILHLAGNMIYLWVFGDNIEDALGHGKYLLFYLAGGLFASLAHIASTLFLRFTSPFPYVVADLAIPAVGASGSISATLGAYLLLFPRARIRTLVIYIVITIVRIPAYYYLFFWFLYQLIMGAISLTGLSSGVAFWAHIGGFIFGMVVVKAFNVTPRTKMPQCFLEGPIRPLFAPLIRSPLAGVQVIADRIMVMANLPGVEKNNIRIEVSKNIVVISAENNDIKFYRQITLPVPVIPKIENFDCRNGVLYFPLHRAI
jgi:membrane associated rhomboid family serine protease